MGRLINVFCTLRICRECEFSHSMLFIIKLKSRTVMGQDTLKVDCAEHIIVFTFARCILDLELIVLSLINIYDDASISVDTSFCYFLRCSNNCYCIIISLSFHSFKFRRKLLTCFDLEFLEAHENNNMRSVKLEYMHGGN